MKTFFFSTCHFTFDRVSLVKVGHTHAVCSYCGRIRVPLPYHLYQSFWIPTICVHVKSTVLIKMSFCTPERVATVELIGLLARATLCINHSSSSRWRYSPGWALASSTMCLQASRFLALSFHSFKPIFLRSVDTSSNHLIFGSSSSSCCIQLSLQHLFLELRCLAFFLCDLATVFFGI